MQQNQRVPQGASFTSIPDDVIYGIYSVLAEIDPPLPCGKQSQIARFKQQQASLGWIKLTHVNLRLRVVALEMSKLWARIVCTFPAGCKTILERARDAPLTLDPTFGSIIEYLRILPAYEVLPRAFHINDAHYGLDLINRLWWKNTTLQSLKSLRLDYADPTIRFHKFESIATLGYIVAPNMITYEAAWGFIPFQAPLLRSLSISGRFIAWKILIDSLRSCPLLTELIILDVRNSSLDDPTGDDRVILSHLETLTICSPWDSTIIVRFLGWLVFPSSADVQFGKCSSTSTFRDLLQYHRSPLRSTTLSISETTDGIRTIDAGDRILEISVSDRTYREYSEYRTRLAGTVEYRQKYLYGSVDESTEIANRERLARILTESFTPSTAAAVQTLAFYGGPPARTRSEGIQPVEPLLSPGVLKALRRPLLDFRGITTIYTPGPSARLYVLLEASSSTSHTEPLFPSLKTIILDIRIRIAVSSWNRFIDIIAYLKAEGRPLDRLVVMGSHLCHIYTGDTRVDVDLERARSNVGEVLDLRDGGCACDTAEA
ncbi:unnamed protein product [Peniophora sp. CBMAI 1063]|nr:unnamed protein product [Peniophora sp. CBMAI 1063]